MNEAQLTTQFGGQWKKEVSPAWVKIPDPNQMDAYRGSEKRPFDIFGCLHGVGFAVEFKLHKSNARAFPFDRVEAHQEYWLKTWKDAGGCGLLGVGIWDPPIKEIVFIDIYDWLKRKECRVRQSVPLGELRQIAACRCERFTQPARWDVQTLRYTILNMN